MSNRFVSFAVKDFILHARSSCFYFDLAELEAKMRALVGLGDEQVKFIFPVKSFPHKEVLQLAGHYLNGFDVSNHAELELVKPWCKSQDILWSSSPHVWTPDIDKVVMDGAHVNAAWPQEATRALRVHVPSPQLRSRFGTSVDDVKHADLEREGITALHFHHGEIPVNLSAMSHGLERIAKLLGDHGHITQVNLGGGFSGLSDGDVEALVRLARRLFRRQMIVFEPGRWLCGSAGILVGSVTETIPHAVTTLSRDGHLRWQREPFTIAIHPLHLGEPQKFSRIKFVGASCNEADQLGEISAKEISLAKGDLVVVNNVTGYSLAWNHSFNGVAAADVVFFKA
jgi:diaminopimelate decarboxylase